VLLTHPRNLPSRTSLLRAGGRAAHAPLAVAVDAHGEVHFSEVRHGAPVTIGRFHLDLAAPRPHPRRPAERALLSVEGDHEPVSFRSASALAAITSAFSLRSTTRRVVVDGRPVRHAVRLAHRRQRSRNLPRVVVQGKILTDIHQVLAFPAGSWVAGPSAFAAGRRSTTTRDRPVKVRNGDAPSQGALADAQDHHVLSASSATRRGDL